MDETRANEDRQNGGAVPAEALARFLDALMGERFGIGLRERLDAHRLADAVGDSEALDMGAALASLIVKDPARRARFDTLFQLHLDRAEPTPPPPLPPRPPEGPIGWKTQIAIALRTLVARRFWRSPRAWAGMAALALALVIVGPSLFSKLWPGGTLVPPPNPTATDRASGRAPAQPPREPLKDAAKKQSPSELMTTFLQSAPSIAPTLREVYDAGWLRRFGSEISLARLVRETGLDPDWPIPIENDGYFLLVQRRVHDVVNPGEPFGDFAANIWDGGGPDSAPERHFGLFNSEVDFAKLRLAVRLSTATALEIAQQSPAERERRLRGLLFGMNDDVDWNAFVATRSRDDLDRILIIAMQIQRNPREDDLHGAGKYDLAREIDEAAALAIQQLPPEARRDRLQALLTQIYERRAVTTTDLDEETRALLREVRAASSETLEQVLAAALTIIRNPTLQGATARRAPELALMPIPGAFPGAAWLPKPAAGVVMSPWWLAYLAGLVPLVFASWRLSHRRDDRRAYLNSRMPRLPPTLSELHLEAPRRLTGDYADLHRSAHSLQVRVDEDSIRLDAEASILATARAGGLYTPVRRKLRRPPDYLALIEARGIDDLDAARLAGLVQRLADAGVAFERYYFIGDPRNCYADLTGPPTPLEDLAARYPDHRLILLGEARGFLDPVTFDAEPWAETLQSWERRAWLTPAALADWGRNEFELARRLDLPVGRATVEGLAILAELLGLDGREDRPLYRPDESNAANVRALPEVLRIEAARYMAAVPLDSESWQALDAELHDYLGQGGYRWLSVLAIWPQLQWDMTLFLGVNLPDDGGLPLYTEARVAALTQLPWLRAGKLPGWLRRRLIAELPTRVRAEATALIWQLLDGRIGANKGPGTVTWRLGHERAAERRAPGVRSGPVPGLLRETIFLETLAGERIPDHDLMLEVPEQARRGVLAQWLADANIAWPDIEIAGLGLLLAAGLFALTPGAAAPLPTGAFLPALVAFATLALVCAGSKVNSTSGRSRKNGRTRQRLNIDLANWRKIWNFGAELVARRLGRTQNEVEDSNSSSRELESDGLEIIEIEGTLQSYDPAKGYGFIAPDQGGELILLHVTALRAGGYQLAYPGARIRCSVLKRPKGLQVFRVFSMDDSAADKSRGIPNFGSLVISPDAPWERVTVKWFNRIRGFGFLTRGVGSHDIYIGMDVVRHSAFTELRVGQVLLARVGQGPKGHTAAELRPIDNIDPQRSELEKPDRALAPVITEPFVFLAFVRKHADAALYVRRALESAGIAVWSADQVDLGEEIKATIDRSLADAVAIVAIWGDGSESSDWLVYEMQRAVELGKLLPVQLDDAQIPQQFNHIQFAPLHSKPMAPPGSTDLTGRMMGWSQNEDVMQLLIREIRAAELERRAAPPPQT